MSDTNIEETLSSPSVEVDAPVKVFGSEAKNRAIGVAFYGEAFHHYMKVEEYRELIPAYKEYYYQKMIADTGSKLTHILKGFNEELELNAEDPENVKYFHPNTTTIRRWKDKWNKDILMKKGLQLEVIDTRKQVQQVLRTRGKSDSPERVYAAPDNDALEIGLQTFAGELMNDAMQMLHDDQEMEDIYDTDELIRRRNYMVNVFGHVTKMAQGKATLMLKASADKREDAHFLMDLMGQASAGQMLAEDIQELRKTYQPTDNPIVHVQAN